MTPAPAPRRGDAPFGPLDDRPVLAAVLGALTIAFSAIFVRLADVSRSTAAIFRCVYALPPLALLAWLGENPSLFQLLGVACILAGLLITTLRARRRPLAEPEIG